MASLINITPTRMELKKLKERLTVSRKGHRLMSDKRDGLMQHFLSSVRKAKEIREQLAGNLAEIDTCFAEAAAIWGRKAVTEALLLPGTQSQLKTGEKNIMSVNVPIFSYSITSKVQYPYGFAFTSGEMDTAARKVTDIAKQLTELAETEKTAMLLCREIERSRRRVNALEHIIIPQYEKEIRRIQMKLDENERSSVSRLMKVKDMMVKSRISEDK